MSALHIPSGTTTSPPGEHVPVGLLIGSGVLQNYLNALSKVAKLFNLLGREANCVCCKR